MTTIEVALQAVLKIKDVNLKEIVIDSLEKKGDWINSVQAFHALYDCPDDIKLGTTKGIVHMTDDRLRMRLDLIDEEFAELQEAVEKRDEIEAADALGDLIYVITGMALEMGIDLAVVVAEIQASNMTKLGADGEVVRREDGKILKGPDYREPDIKSVLKYR